MKIAGDHRLANTQISAFTLIELLVVIAIIGILAALLMPVLSRAKETGRRIACLNNIRQLSMASQMYVNDNHGAYPPRREANSWPIQFSGYYDKNAKLLLCPTDVASSFKPPASWYPPPRSYIMNGWDDYFYRALGIADWNTLETFLLNSDTTMKQSAIVHPSQTVVLGEKRHDDKDFYMDLLENGGNDYTGVLEQGRHSNNGHTSNQMKGAGSTGGSNYALTDGSARFIKFPQAVCPLNLWTISDADRVTYAITY